MRIHWLALIGAALVLPAAPASAQLDGGSGFTAADRSSGSVDMHRGGDGPGWRDGRHGDGWGDWRRDGRRDGRRDRHRRSDVYLNYYGGAWAEYNNRGWESDSYNDWWHERSDRSVPRWVQRNGNCQRQYWSGGGWTC